MCICSAGYDCHHEHVQQGAAYKRTDPEALQAPPRGEGGKLKS